MSATGSPALPLEFAGEQLGGVCAEVVHGIELLERSPRLWGDLLEWTLTVDAVKSFALRWDRRARAAGWSTLELYGVHRHAPATNLSAMGAAFMMALSGHRAIAVEPQFISMRTFTGSVLRFFRFTPPPGAAAAWSLIEALPLKTHAVANR